MKNTLLRAARLRKGWSQQQLAELAGIGISTVERAERGRPLRIDTIHRLAACLEKTPEQLGLVPLGYPQERFEQRERATAGYRGDGEAVLEAKEHPSSPLVKLTPEQVAAFLQLLALGDITMTPFDPQRRAALLHLLSTTGTSSVAPQ